MFYTYFHTRNDTGKVFYVGKGKGRRAHELGRNPHWRNIVAKHGHTVHFAMTNLSENEAFEHEKFLISCFKSMGSPLTNMTDGGDGMSGYVAPPDVVERNRQRAKLQMQDPRQIEIQREAAKKRWANPEKRAVYIASLTASSARDIVKKKRSDAAVSRWADSEEREKQAARTRAHYSSEEARLAQSKRLTGKTLSDETKKKLSNARKGRKFTERTKERMREAWVLRKLKFAVSTGTGVNPGT